MSTAQVLRSTVTGSRPTEMPGEALSQATGRAPTAPGFRRFLGLCSLPAGLGWLCGFLYWLSGGDALTAWGLALGVALGSAVFLGRFLHHELHRSLRQIERLLYRLGTGDPLTLPAGSDPAYTRIVTACRWLAGLLEQTSTAGTRDVRRLRLELSQRENESEALRQEVRRLRAQAQIFQEFSRALSRGLDPAHLCGQLIEVVRDQFQYARAAALLVDGAGALHPVAVHDRQRGLWHVGEYVRALSTLQQPVITGVAEWVYQTGRPLRLGTVAGDPRCPDAPSQIAAVLAVPLRVQDKVVGVVQLEHTQPQAYTPEDEQLLLALAIPAAIAVDNARLWREAAQVQALRELDRLKSELLSTVSHELRTPLASIKGYATTLLREDVTWDPEEQREFLRIIDEESDRLSELIADLLEMSQIEAGVLKVDLQPTSLPRIVQRVVRKARRQTDKHSFRVSFPVDFPLVMADPRRIEQVVRNLVENAIKYSPDGGQIAIAGEVRDGMAVISVRDQGIGIAPQDLERIFDRFYRADHALRKQTGGTGIGLSICRGIVEMHGGRIWAESRPGQGSTFTFTLPIAPPEAEQAEAEPTSDRYASEEVVG